MNLLFLTLSNMNSISQRGIYADLMRKFRNEGHNVFIQMTLTAPNCPMADYVVDQVKSAIEDVPGVVTATIELVFEPVWDKSRMSEEALVELGLDED